MEEANINIIRGSLKFLIVASMNANRNSEVEITLKFIQSIPTKNESARDIID